jgi:hypothetical protein
VARRDADKMKVSVQDFFQDFYDSQVFHPVIAGQDMKWSYIDIAYDSIVNIDKLFNSVDRNIFRKEMIAVRMDMVGLAFTHIIKNMERLLNQSLFTKDYLIKNGQSEIWDIMGEYTHAIAKSSTDIVKGERALRATILMINDMRSLLFEKYMNKYFKEGMDVSCITHVCNKEGCEVAWSKKVTLKYLVASFADRVRCNESINPEAIMAIATVIWGFYQGAKDAIKSINFG